MDVKLSGAALKILPSATTVGTTATPIPATALATRRSIYVFNNAAAGGSTLFVGNASVSTTNGTPIPPQSGLSINAAAGVLIFGIVSSSTVDVRCLELA